MLVVYLLIIRGLYKLSHSLDEAGFVVQPAPVKLSDWAVAAVIAGVLAAGALVSYLFLSGYPMDWQPVEAVESTERTEICEQLTELGFPEGILDDLTDEDILACKDAAAVVVTTNNYPVNDGNLVWSGRSSRTVYEVKELRITGIGVLLEGERERWKLFHYFTWTTDPGFPGTESIQIWPTSRLSEGWWMDGEPSGRLLVDRDGQTYTRRMLSLAARATPRVAFCLAASLRPTCLQPFRCPVGERINGVTSVTPSGKQWTGIHQQLVQLYPSAELVPVSGIDIRIGESAFRQLELERAVQAGCRTRCNFTRPRGN